MLGRARRTFRWTRSESPASLPTNTTAQHKTNPTKTKQWSQDQVLEVVERIAAKIGINQLSDWYKVTVDEFEGHGGQTVSKAHNWSLSAVLARAYPEHKWEPWRFQHVSAGHWNTVEHRREFCDHLFKALNLTKMEDWYGVKINQVLSNGGGGILRGRHSVYKLVASAYPDHPWKPWLFKQVPNGYWNPQTRAVFIKWVEEILGVRTKEDWYSHSGATVAKHGGRGMMKDFKGNLYETLKSVYPDHEWIPWKFSTVPNKFWMDKHTHKLYFDWLEKQLGITKKSDWYSVGHDQVHKNHGGGLLYNYYGDSLGKALPAVYPDHQWIPFSRTTKRDANPYGSRGKPKRKQDQPVE